MTISKSDLSAHDPELRVRPLTRALVPDFFAVNCDANGLGWCHCVAWWCDDWSAFGARTAAENRAHRERLWDQGHFDGYLLYLDNRPVGWSQVGLRDRLPNLVARYGFGSPHSPQVADPSEPVYAVTCFAFAPDVRGRGLVHSFLRIIVADLESKGATRIQGYPKRDTDDPWTGPEAAFQKCGFRLVRDHQTFPVYERRRGQPAL